MAETTPASTAATKGKPNLWQIAGGAAVLLAVLFAGAWAISKGWKTGKS